MWRYSAPKVFERNSMDTKDTKAECSSANRSLPPIFFTERSSSLLKQRILGNLPEINLEILKPSFF